MARGDHLQVRRLLGYCHQGIDMGDGTVIHFQGEPTNLANAEVRRTSFEEFAMGGEVETITHEERLEVAEIIQRAKARIGQRGYNPVTNNCEHFAYWCVTGRAKSPQVREIAKAFGVAVAILAGTAILYKVKDKLVPSSARRTIVADARPRRRLLPRLRTDQPSLPERTE